ncbi:MAG: type II secretion system GspH family protein, partial [Candidatus Calescibacterium sp.]|nr:type II secretion system GspH family protein [Candidatus Calescibacterium sp.]
MSDRQILKNQKGFTLLELMIVIAIISILALVLIPNFVLARNQAKISSCQSNIKLIATAIENYAVSNRDQYPDTDFIINDSSIIEEYLDR